MPRRRAKKILRRERCCPGTYTKAQVGAAMKTVFRDQNREKRKAWAELSEEERESRRSRARWSMLGIGGMSVAALFLGSRSSLVRGAGCCKKTKALPGGRSRR
jgi:hypothetical protein